MINLRECCPLCKGKQWRTSFRLKGFNIVQCRSCGLCFRSVSLSTSSLKDLYSENYFTSEQVDYFFNHSWEKERLFQKRMKMIQSYTSNQGELLDIGCAIGTFLKIARSSGWKVHGAEISEFASQYARNIYGLDVTCGDFNKAKFVGRKFDVITMWDVVDHSEDPVAFLADAFCLLKNDGYLFVQTTMEDSFIYRVAKYIYKLSFGLIKSFVIKGHPIYHSTFFSQKSLRKTLEFCGFRVKRIELSEYPADFLRGSVLTKQIFKLFSELGNKLGMPLEVTFIAQKR